MIPIASVIPSTIRRASIGGTSDAADGQAVPVHDVPGNASPVSFEISRTERMPHSNRAEQLQRAFITRLDRVNSAQLIAQARSVYWHFLSAGGTASPPPRGVVLQGTWGRVVFSWPTLLPEELFVPGDWITGPGPLSGRTLRSRTRAQPACPNQQP